MQILKKYCDVCKKETDWLYKRETRFGSASYLLEEYCADCLIRIERAIVEEINKIKKENNIM